MPRYVAAAAAISWIDSRTGLPEVDEIVPGPSISRRFIVGNSGYRFSHLLDVWADYDAAAGRFLSQGVTADNGIYRGPSFARVPSWKFPVQTSTTVAKDAVHFVQIVGARTVSPEVLGGAIGLGAGAAGGAGAGALIGSAGGPIGAGVGAIIGGVVGAGTGEVVAHQVTGFPPIWSELKVTIFKDGRSAAELLRYSLFPSLSYYIPDRGSSSMFQRTNITEAQKFYDAVPYLERWKREGWGPIRGAGAKGPTAGNPWNDAKGAG